MPHILIADDDDFFRDYLRLLLERSGYTVHALNDGSNVAAAISRGAYDAVITDLYMPRADGIETVRALRKLAPATPVIGLTGAYMGFDDPCIQALRRLGAEVVLHKTVRSADILQAVESAIEGTAATGFLSEGMGSPYQSVTAPYVPAAAGVALAM